MGSGAAVHGWDEALNCREMTTVCREHVTLQRDELDIPLDTPEGQILLGARDVIAEEAFAAEFRKESEKN